MIFGYNAVIPTTLEGNLFTTDALDDACEWVANANSYLWNFVRDEQSYAQAISLKRMCGAAVLSKSNIYTFTVDEKMFPIQRHVRLRGINLFAVWRSGESGGPGGAVKDTFLSATVQPPNTASELFLCDVHPK